MGQGNLISVAHYAPPTVASPPPHHPERLVYHTSITGQSSMMYGATKRGDSPNWVLVVMELAPAFTWILMIFMLIISFKFLPAALVHVARGESHHGIAVSGAHYFVGLNEPLGSISAFMATRFTFYHQWNQYMMNWEKKLLPKQQCN